MTPQAQRISIAEACGWKSVEVPLCDDLGPIGRRKRIKWYKGKRPYSNLLLSDKPPDYLADLNAIHEAEQTLKDLMTYCEQLCAVVYAPLTTAHLDNNLEQGWWFMHATAAQRGEAFLRTIGKWTD